MTLFVASTSPIKICRLQSDFILNCIGATTRQGHQRFVKIAKGGRVGSFENALPIGSRELDMATSVKIEVMSRRNNMGVIVTFAGPICCRCRHLPGGESTAAVRLNLT